MAGFLVGMVTGPENNEKQLVELVADYAQNVPELLPALRDVITYGILYDQKMEVFVDLMKQERKRQRHLSGGEGYETDYPENVGNVRVCLAEMASEAAVLGKKKKKKKKKKKNLEQIHLATDETQEKIQTDETLETNIGVDMTDVDHTEYAENVEEPPTKNKQKKKRKILMKGRNRDNLSLGCVDNQSLQLNGCCAISSMVQEDRAQEDEKPKNEAKEEDDPDETNWDKSILINTVEGEQNGIVYKTASSNEKTPRKRSASVLRADSSSSTPFRVIPSVRLMVNPTKFPDLATMPVEPTSSGTPTAKKWRVTFEFDSSFAQSGIMSPAEVCSILEQFGLKNVRVLKLAKSGVQSNNATVEFLCTDFLSAASRFSGLCSSVEGTPRIIGVSPIIDGPTSEEKCDAPALISSMVNLPPLEEEANLGELDRSNSVTVTPGAEQLVAPKQGGEMETAQSALQPDNSGVDTMGGTPSTSSVRMSPQSRNSDSQTDNIRQQQSLVESELRTSSPASYHSPAALRRDGNPPSQCKPCPPAHQRPLDQELFQLLKSRDEREDCLYACLSPFAVSAAMHKCLSVNKHETFIRWMDLKKQEILAKPSLISKHVLFRPARFWFREFYKYERDLSHRRNCPPNRGRRGYWGRGNNRLNKGRSMR